MIYAMAAMVLLATVVALITVTTRMRCVKQGQVKARYFKLMEGQDVPEEVVKTGRNFNNQFEVPVLFYVVATLHVVLQLEDTFALYVGWAFVAFRYLHAIIHLTYNHVLHRLSSFFAGFVCVLLLWGHLLMMVS